MGNLWLCFWLLKETETWKERGQGGREKEREGEGEGEGEREHTKSYI